MQAQACIRRRFRFRVADASCELCLQVATGIEADAPHQPGASAEGLDAAVVRIGGRRSGTAPDEGDLALFAQDLDLGIVREISRLDRPAVGIEHYGEQARPRCRTDIGPPPSFPVSRHRSRPEAGGRRRLGDCCMAALILRC